VTNQVTAPPDHDGWSPTQPDNGIALTCRNTTQRDAARRNRQAWHARGQGFESPKLHVSRRSAAYCDLEKWLLTSCNAGRGRGFLSAKLHVSAGQRHISTVKMASNLLQRRQVHAPGWGLPALEFPQLSPVLRVPAGGE
jgi:hypothetical protein